MCVGGSAMDRAAMIVMLAIATTGCARDVASFPPRIVGPPEIPDVEPPPGGPPRASLNQGKIPADPSTVRASYVPESIPDAEEPSTPPASPVEPPPPPSDPASPPKIATTTPTAARAEASAGSDAMPLRTSANLDPGNPAVITAAVVGGTIITYRELKAALCRDYQCKPQDLGQIPEDHLNEMAKATLDRLIDRALILQEAQRDMTKKNGKQWTMFREAIEKSWHTHEVPPMCKTEKVPDEFALAKRLEERGESLTDLKIAYLEKTMADEIVMMRVRDKVEKPGFHEKKAYYEDHKNEPEYHRDPRIAWNEIFLAAETPEALTSARARAEAIRARILAGEDFTKVAKAESAGVTAKFGGEWETDPNGYAVPAVNGALQSLPSGEVSPPIVGPKGVHLVRVRSRTQGGIASFPEVQHDIAKAMFEQRFIAQITEYLQGLRERTPITSPMFKGLSTIPATAGAKSKPKTDGEARRTSRP